MDCWLMVWTNEISLQQWQPTIERDFMHLSLLQVKLLYSQNCFANTKINENKKVFGEIFEIQTVSQRYLHIFKHLWMQWGELSTNLFLLRSVQTKSKDIFDASLDAFVLKHNMLFKMCGKKREFSPFLWTLLLPSATWTDQCQVWGPVG